MQCAWKGYLLSRYEAAPILIRFIPLAAQICPESGRCSRFGSHPPKPEKTPCQLFLMPLFPPSARMLPEKQPNPPQEQLAVVIVRREKALDRSEERRVGKE